MATDPLVHDAVVQVVEEINTPKGDIEMRNVTTVRKTRKPRKAPAVVKPAELRAALARVAKLEKALKRLSDAARKAVVVKRK